MAAIQPISQRNDFVGPVRTDEASDEGGDRCENGRQQKPGQVWCSIREEETAEQRHYAYDEQSRSSPGRPHVQKEADRKTTRKPAQRRANRHGHFIHVRHLDTDLGRPDYLKDGVRGAKAPPPVARGFYPRATISDAVADGGRGAQAPSPVARGFTPAR
jgi:hypothetical protein